MPTTIRDNFLCQDYKDGKEINELARSYGLSERRISQILSHRNIPRRPRPMAGKKALSQVHTRIGLHLYTYRFNKKLEAMEAADAIGWGVIKLRKVEKGVREVEILDLLDIAAYTQTPVSKLLFP